MRRRRHRFKTIPKDAEQAILALADEYPGLSQNGLQDEVERIGIKADPHELKLFLREHGRRPPPAGLAYRRRGMWDTGWPTWGYRNPVGDMDWPNGEPFEVRFPFWGWADKQPLWFRLFMALGVLLPLGFGIYEMFTRR